MRTLLDLTVLHRGYTAGNITAALKAVRHILSQGWTPLAPYPGSDTLWRVRCELCGTEVLRFYSHLRRGRPLKRHGGCLPVAEQAAALAALPTAPRVTFSAGQILWEALSAAGHTAWAWATGGGCDVIAVRLTAGPAEIWISDVDARIGYDPQQHTGWTAEFRPQGVDSCGDEARPLYESHDHQFGSDTEQLVKAIGTRAAAYAAEQAQAAD
ncbi:hypothetical protein ACFYMW_39170 [Streptomyces sp. NPDC006692]|uniref:hypothetical protein n=1 Tax=unclassified Streptomyces TaxID=2593676 RepID=UPI0036C2E219